LFNTQVTKLFFYFRLYIVLYPGYGAVFLFQAVHCILRWLRNKDDNYHGLIAGFLAGWTMVFYKSTTIALYLALKLAEVITWTILTTCLSELIN